MLLVQKKKNKMIKTMNEYDKQQQQEQKNEDYNANSKQYTETRPVKRKKKL